MKKRSLTSLLRQVHEDERGTVSLETILIIGAIALPVLIFVIVKGWPLVKAFFDKNMTDLQSGSDAAAQGN